jgi:hydrogenase-4 membrane subunit HyfE
LAKFLKKTLLRMLSNELCLLRPLIGYILKDNSIAHALYRTLPDAPSDWLHFKKTLLRMLSNELCLLHPLIGYILKENSSALAQ